MQKLKNSELNRISVSEFKEAKKNPVVVILDNIRSMNNVGSTFRTSDAFRVEKIFLCGITAQPPHRDIQKTALGATESVAWEYRKDTTECINLLREEGYKIYAVEQCRNSIMLNNFTTQKEEKIAVIFGNEVKGVEQKAIDLCDGCIEIPQEGTKHSFNISVSVGIVLWDIYSKKYYLPKK